MIPPLSICDDWTVGLKTVKFVDEEGDDKFPDSNPEQFPTNLTEEWIVLISDAYYN